MSSEIALSLITAASGLCGAGIGAWASTHAQREAQRQAEKHDVASAVASFSHALDRLEYEWVWLPVPRTRPPVPDSPFARVSDTEYSLILLFLRRFQEKVPLTQALKDLSATHARLVLVAPPALLESAESVMALLPSSWTRDEAWYERWRTARARLAAVTRQSLGAHVAAAAEDAWSPLKDLTEMHAHFQRLGASPPRRRRFRRWCSR